MPLKSLRSRSATTQSACDSVIQAFNRSNARRNRPFSNTSRSSPRSAASVSRGTYVQPSLSSSSRAGFSA